MTDSKGHSTSQHMSNPAPTAEPHPSARDILGALLMYARHPATANSEHWVSIMVPEDFIERAEQALAQE